jgi:hypothetical protein
MGQPEDIIIREKRKEDIGKTRFSQSGAIGSALNWREAVVGAVSLLR